MADEESNSNISQSSEEKDDALINELPSALFWDAMEIRKWQGFWFEPGLIKCAMKFSSSFQAGNDDVLLASAPKTGTTWLKALCLCILHQNHNIPENEDLLTKDNPQFHVQTVESSIYSTKPTPDLYSTPSPRLIHSHLPFHFLPNSIINSNCKIVCVARNPKDTLVSLWHFFNSIFRGNQEPYPLEKAVDEFCTGVHQYGPYFENVLGYWLESQKRPEKILFLKYEEMIKDPKEQVRKLGLFLGKPFEKEEDLEKVVWRCSLERLRNLEVNKNGSVIYGVPNASYFRKGIVGDWKNYLNPEMENRINQTTHLKFKDSRLEFEELLES
uniref:Sulfotransferase n=1 Tax=Solanum lycopersicum TaxID=4081 RepID=A0A3Q7FLE7_SOLLC|nr:cytosolic sulfotransferase 5-like [Solanum lycopersicum]